MSTSATNRLIGRMRVKLRLSVQLFGIRSIVSRPHRRWREWLALLLLALTPLQTMAQPANTAEAPEQINQAGEKNPVEIEPENSDTAIRSRLSDILNATGWYDRINITVRDGVVFIDGLADKENHRQWAGDLANRTQDVVAVVNRLHLSKGSPWDIQPAVLAVQRLIEGAMQRLPILGLALVVLIAAWFFARAVLRIARHMLARRLQPLLNDVVARAAAVATFVVGIYLVMNMAGLTRLAASIIGGTGLAGLVAGIAFRDILENFLASILISLRNPFQVGDLVSIMDHTGIIQRVTSRGTVLMDLSGNHIQIPNAIVYKNIIQNYTANPKRKESFEVGIGYENDIATAQETALNVLQKHPGVLKDPAPLILADRLGSATVVLKLYFWYDGLAYNGISLRSSLIRLVKQKFQNAQISMPDEAREIVFPEGVPVALEKTVPPFEVDRKDATAAAIRVEPEGEQDVFIAAEGDLANDSEPIRQQARESRDPEESPSLMADSTSVSRQKHA